MYINLLVTGSASSGKTVAVCCTYNHMTKGGLIGDKQKFGLIAQGDTALKDNKELSMMYINMMDGKLPNGTTETSLYNFAFQRDGKTICNIHWTDYRGALIEEDRNKSAFKKDVEDFLDALNHMALLVYIISGEVIDEYIRTKEAALTDVKKIQLRSKVQIEINQIKALIDEAEKNWWEETKKDDTRPILFYVTKSDLIKYDDDRKLKELVSMLDEYGLLLNGNRKILGCHSTLGRNLILTEDNRISDGFEPEGFEIPLMLAVGYALSEEGKKWERDESARLDALIDNKEIIKMTAIDERSWESNRIINKLKFWQTENKRITALNQQISENNIEIQKLRNEKTNLKSNNVLSKYSQNILDYIENLGTYTIFVDEKGEEQPLEEFFK